MSARWDAGSPAAAACRSDRHQIGARAGPRRLVGSRSRRLIHPPAPAHRSVQSALARSTVAAARAALRICGLRKALLQCGREGLARRPESPALMHAVQLPPSLVFARLSWREEKAASGLTSPQVLQACSMVVTWWGRVFGPGGG